MNRIIPHPKKYLTGLILVAAVFLPQAATNPGKQVLKALNPIKEIDLARVVLTKDAETRLAVRTESIQEGRIPRYRVFGAEIIFPMPQRTGADDDSDSDSGVGYEYSTFQDLDPATEAKDAAELIKLQLAADEKIGQARVELEAGQIELDRAENLLRGKAGSVRAVDNARARVEMARVKLVHAQRQRDFLGASLEGRLNLKDLWVKVSVYAGDYARLNHGVGAELNELSGLPGQTSIPLVPVSAPPTADPNAYTVDLYYRLKSNDRELRPGQRVMVNVPLKDEMKSLIVPWSAVVRDIYGGAWIYVNTEPQTFERRRVIVRHVVGDLAVLQEGPEVGAQVVVQGAAELFGSEFGVGK